MDGFCYNFFLIILISCYIINAYEDLDRVTVAVYEHRVILPPFTIKPVSRAKAVGHMMRNLKIMQRQAEKASARGAKLIVLPEDGIYGFLLNRQTIYPYLEYIPNPSHVSSVPCDNLDYTGNEVQRFLSCLARNMSMYVVANMGDRQACCKTEDPNCPVDGHYQYNTDVVFNPLGKLVARYHKNNLYHESAFDVPKNVEKITFDTPFGTFGVFTCFDVLYYGPAVELVQNLEIRNIVFPTAWFDVLPHLSAIGFHSAFATRWKVNYLAANVHFPEVKAQGSGIYANDGTRTYVYDAKSKDGHLLVADIPVLKSKLYEKSNHTINRSNLQTENLKKSYNDTEFQSYVFHDLYNFVTISGMTGSKNVCQNNVCCKIVYNKTTDTDELYAFGAFDGLHTYNGEYYLQVCTLLKCKTKHYKSCGEETTEANTDFYQLEITTNSKGYIYPELMLSDSGTLTLSSRWSFNQLGVLNVRDGLEKPVLSASLVARVYNIQAKRIRTNT